MDSGTIWGTLAGLLVGAGATLVAGAWWWGRKLGEAAQRVAKLEQARQFSEQQATQVRRQVEQMQKEMAELRQQASRAKPRRDAPAVSASREEIEDLLLRDAPPRSAADPFPATQILPRKF